MSKWLNLILQALGFTAQVVIPAVVSDPGTAKGVHGAIALAQGATALVAHYYNPDGTPAKVAWEKK